MAEISRRRTPKKTWALALSGAAAVLVAAPADAHFTLDYPPQWVVQDALGDPQKVAPCGVDSTVTYTPTNTVTTYAPGETITLQWTETVAHDGWFRIAVSYDNRADLTDPPYSANALGLSTDAGIENPPVAPVLVDGLYPHLAANITTPKTYTYALKLPEKPCTKCTLQVVQFMNNHPYNMPGGYFYHHCADIAIVPGADGGSSMVAPGGTSSGGKAGADGGGTTQGAGSSGGSKSGGSGGGSTPGSNGGTGASSGNGSEGADDGGGSGAGGGSQVIGTSSSGSGCNVSSAQGSAAVGLGALGLLGVLGARRRRRAG